MKMKSLLSAGLGAFALGLLTTAAQAGPSGGLTGAVDQSAARGDLVENVTWYGDGYYGYGRPHHYGYGHRWHGHRYHYRPYYGYRWYGHRHYGWRHYPRYGYRYW